MIDADDDGCGDDGFAGCAVDCGDDVDAEVGAEEEDSPTVGWSLLPPSMACNIWVMCVLQMCRPHSALSLKQRPQNRHSNSSSSSFLGFFFGVSSPPLSSGRSGECRLTPRLMVSAVICCCCCCGCCTCCGDGSTAICTAASALDVDATAATSRAAAGDWTTASTTCGAVDGVAVVFDHTAPYVVLVVDA